MGATKTHDIKMYKTLKQPNSFLNSLFSDVIFFTSFFKSFISSNIPVKMAVILPISSASHPFVTFSISSSDSSLFDLFFCICFINLSRPPSPFPTFDTLSAYDGLPRFVFLLNCITFQICIFRGLMRAQLRQPFLYLTSNSRASTNFAIITFITYDLLNR